MAVTALLMFAVSMLQMLSGRFGIPAERMAVAGFAASNVMLVCPSCEKGRRVRMQAEKDGENRTILRGSR